MFFVGIDLAWSYKNGSGVAIIDGDEKKGNLLSYDILNSDSEIIDYINRNVKDNDAIIAIDAPLVVTNEEGRRDAERIVGTLFRKYDAGAHPSNRKRLSQWSGTIRGEEIAKLLENNGFKHNPDIRKFESSRKFIEVYPHPSMVVLFGLDRILRYKAKPKRDYEFRWAEFERYRSHLKALENANPSLILPDELLEGDIKELRAGKLKDYEDTLDAVFCAYIAYYCWSNPENCAVLGSLEDGYILTPIFDFMKQQLRDMDNQRNLGEF